MAWSHSYLNGSIFKVTTKGPGLGVCATGFRTAFVEGTKAPSKQVPSHPPLIGHYGLAASAAYHQRAYRYQRIH